MCLLPDVINSAGLALDPGGVIPLFDMACRPKLIGMEGSASLGRIPTVSRKRGSGGATRKDPAWGAFSLFSDFYFNLLATGYES